MILGTYILILAGLRRQIHCFSVSSIISHEFEAKIVEERNLPNQCMRAETDRRARDEHAREEAAERLKRPFAALQTPTSTRSKT